MWAANSSNWAVLRCLGVLPPFSSSNGEEGVFMSRPIPENMRRLFAIA